jgi:hypothetical protein
MINSVAFREYYFYGAIPDNVVENIDTCCPHRRAVDNDIGDLVSLFGVIVKPMLYPEVTSGFPMGKLYLLSRL